MPVVLIGLMVAALSGLVLLVAGPGYRFDIWGLRPAFTLFRWAAYGGIAGGGLSLLGLIVTRHRKRAVPLAVLCVLIGGTVLYIPWRWREIARSVPPIHDITTDTENSPEFRAVLPLRADAPNPVEYGGPELAAQQRAAYPEIQPLRLPGAPEEVFPSALASALEMGWEIVAADALAGRIEATATTFWFGFKDDVVIRITAADGWSSVDVRSVSRLGRSDLGTNARRIREYLAKLQAE